MADNEASRSIVSDIVTGMLARLEQLPEVPRELVDKLRSLEAKGTLSGSGDVEAAIRSLVEEASS